MKRFFSALCSLFLVLSLITPPSVFAQSIIVSNTPQDNGGEFTATAPCVPIPVGNGTVVSTAPPPGCDLGGSGTSDYALKLVKAITNNTNCMLADGNDRYSLPSAPTDKVSSYGLPSNEVAYTSQYFRRVMEGDDCLDILTSQATSIGLPNWDSIYTNDTANQYLNDRPGGYLQCVGFANAVLKGANNVALTPEYNAQDYASHTTEYPDYIWYDNDRNGTNLSKLQAGDALIFSGGTFGHIAIAVKVVPGTVFVAEGNGKGHGEEDIFPYSTDITGTANGGLALVGWFHKK